MARTGLKAYLGGSIRTIERRFGFRSSTTGVILGLSDLAHIVLVLFFGYAGRTGHKPHLIAISSMFPAIAGLLMASPYFILPGGSPLTFREKNPILQNSSASSGHTSTIQMCDGGPKEDGCNNGMDQATQNTIALGLFAFASILGGVGGPATKVLGIPYIDENASRAKTAISVGFITASYALGPVLGLLLASVCTRLPENLQATDMEPTDPNFIGAWWLGFALSGIVVFLLGLPMFFYPKHMTARAAALERELKDNAEVARQHIPGRLLQTMKAIPKSVAKVGRNKAFVALVCFDFFGIFALAGIFMNLPRYMEIHFLMPAYQANIVGAMAAACIGLVGGLTGGTIISRLKLLVPGIAKMLLVCSCAAVIGGFCPVAIRCPKVNLDRGFDVESKVFSLTTSCNENCSCLANKEPYIPICGTEDDLTYFSPCHAGCSQSANGSFYDCGCTEGGNAEAGLCLETCNLILPFALGLVLLSLAGGAGRPAHVMATMRVVLEKDRSLALGINSFIINLFGLLPGPIFFGYMIDTSCDLWQNICGETGNCLFYDTDKFRLRTYGISVILLCANVLALVVFFCIVKRWRTPFESATAGADVPRDVKKGNHVDINNESSVVVL